MTDEATKILEYTEKVAAKSLEVARAGYDDLHERAHKLVTVLLAGGGGVGAFAVGRMQPGTQPIEWAPLLALALSWFGTAGVLVVRGMTSKQLSPGNGPKNLLNYYSARLQDSTSDPATALELTRRAELALVQQRLTSYNSGCIARAQAIDLAYRTLAICSPSVPLIVAALCYLLRFAGAT